jgi:hypothetical protein
VGYARARAKKARRRAFGKASRGWLLRFRVVVHKGNVSLKLKGEPHPAAANKVGRRLINPIQQMIWAVGPTRNPAVYPANGPRPAVCAAERSPLVAVCAKTSAQER